MPEPLDPDKFPFRLQGAAVADALYLLGARVVEGMSFLTETTLDFVSADREIDLQSILGEPLRVIEARFPDGGERIFPGTCISVEFLGTPDGVAHYRADLRPWLWFLGRVRDNRVFQEKTVLEILHDVLAAHGFWGEVDDNTSGSYGVRRYTIQYRESDLDFICRLMEEEGIYFHFIVKDGKERMVLADGPSAHPKADWQDVMKFRMLDPASHRFGAHVFSWQTGLGALTGKVTLTDYDFEKPGSKLLSSNAIAKGRHKNNDLESYDYPGRHVTTAEGSTRARVRMEAEAIQHHTVRGAANLPNLEVGKTFALSEHLRVSENRQWLVTRATHVMRARTNDIPPFAMQMAERMNYGADIIGLDTVGDDSYRVLFDAVPDDLQYRAALVTPWPEISGVHTAVVTGKEGEQIHTDKYGRIKVKFHWDRAEATDEKTSCWVRCMMPWTGSGWGMMAVPRMGQEVVVQFEEGNPDRPLVIGMLYNANTMPPWALDANKTQSGIKTRSTKGGTDKTYNELMFEDKKGAELVRFQSERDYEQIVKNDATITVGEGHKDKGDMDLTVHRNLTETLKTGDHTFTVADGKQTIKVKKDKNETIEGKSTLTVTGDVAETVKMGNRTETIKMGNVTRTLDMGNEATTLKLGNYTVDTKVGKIGMTALQEIKLTCGASTITMTPFDITIKSPMVKIQGDMMVDIKGLMTNVKGDAMVVIKGGLTMIN